MLNLTLHHSYLKSEVGDTIWDILMGEPEAYRKDMTHLELIHNFLEAHPHHNRLFCDESRIEDFKRLGFSGELMSMGATLEEMLTTLDELPSWYVGICDGSIVALFLSSQKEMIVEKDASNIELDAQIIADGIQNNNASTRFDLRPLDYSLTQKHLLALACADGLMHSPVFRAGHVAIFDCDSSYSLRMGPGYFVEYNKIPG